MNRLIVLADTIGTVRGKAQPAFGKNETAQRAAIAGTKRQLIQTDRTVDNALIDRITPTTCDLEPAMVALAKANDDAQFVAAKGASFEVELNPGLDEPRAVAANGLAGIAREAKRGMDGKAMLAELVKQRAFAT